MSKEVEKMEPSSHTAVGMQTGTADRVQHLAVPRESPYPVIPLLQPLTGNEHTRPHKTYTRMPTAALP